MFLPGLGTHSILYNKTFHFQLHFYDVYHHDGIGDVPLEGELP